MVIRPPTSAHQNIVAWIYQLCRGGKTLRRMPVFAITRLRRPRHYMLISLGVERNKAWAGFGSCVECD
jgi:hypothetical protein